MHFTSFLEEGRLTVALTGEIDHHCAKEYIRTIGAKIEAYSPDICVLDFQEVSFVDSSGIAVVINALRSMTQIEGKLILTGLSPQPMRVFRASGIDKLVEVKEAVS
jgi:stage II sporulation protein AA (anti-sigma F factor antagonist)